MVKNAIKRGQSRTCSSYAEREHLGAANVLKCHIHETFLHITLHGNTETASKTHFNMHANADFAYLTSF